MGLMKGQKNITVIKGKGETTENVVKKKINETFDS